MTDVRDQMTRLLLDNIERAKTVMEDGQLGYVCHTADFTLFLCEDAGVMRLGSPLSDNIVVSANDETTQRHWNSRLTYEQIDAGCGVITTLRREALAGFIEIQQSLLDMVLRPAPDALELN